MIFSGCIFSLYLCFLLISHWLIKLQASYDVPTLFYLIFCLYFCDSIYKITLSSVFLRNLIYYHIAGLSYNAICLEDRPPMMHPFCTHLTGFVTSLLPTKCISVYCLYFLMKGRGQDCSIAKAWHNDW